MLTCASYRNQDGCHNCANCKILFDYDAPPYYYCNVNNDIPKYNQIDGNQDHDENGKGYRLPFSKEVEDLLFDRNDVFSRWQELHEVQPYGICDNYKNIDKSL